MATKSLGWLRDIAIGPSEISRITQDAVYYCGEPLDHWIGEGFENTAYHLLGGANAGYSLPSFNTKLAEERPIPQAVTDFIRDCASWAYADYPSMHVLRTAVSLLAQFDPRPEALDTKGLFEKAIRIIAKVPTIVAQIDRLKRQKVQTQEPLLFSEISHAAHFYTMVHGAPPSESVGRILDALFVIYAEHGFAASTLAARVVASTTSDMHSATTAAIGALKGAIHGGANQDATNLLLEIQNHRRLYPEGKVEGAIDRVLRDRYVNGKVPGFGNPVHKETDPRVALLKTFKPDSFCAWEHPDLITAAELDRDRSRDDLFFIADELEKVMQNWQNRHLHPNIEYPVGVILHQMRFHPTIFPAVFAAARAAGWCAHYVEHVRRRCGLMRPRDWYEDQPTQIIEIPPDVHNRHVEVRTASDKLK